MNVMAFLLVPTVALLVGPAALSPARHTDENLNSIIDLADRFNKTKYMTVFVEDLSKSDCGDTFFCKARTILHGHMHGSEDGSRIVKNLNQYIKSRKLNCTEWKPEVSNITLPSFVKVLAVCSQETNLNGGKKSNA